ncbi:tetratricopeptide repeat protein [Cuspidothrix issatschenkoi]|jgi:tetratricopeptide (TPR) repeat protein|uniref:Uncharacterized protein n=1 Tax=Cuspidothrix issatschenkoi CHARLIE-1 TaxID=2052836 RepID=A0A2S6CVH5_9CYAN|nr:tetratricopeptide repeat protein [Cuspidothrix issatschenkoi]PPJ63785.1 hypothetical protein CUN59_08295 [Cuspidothrix issatschenkoi CHARLIE-1]
MTSFNIKEQALLHFNQGNYQQAISLYEEYLTTDNIDLEVSIYLCLALLLENKDELSQNILSSIELSEDIAIQVNFYNQLLDIAAKTAFQLFQKKDIIQAEKLYLFINNLDSSYADSYLGLGMIKFQQNEFNLAIDYLQIFIDLEPQEHIAYYYLGLCYKNQNEWDKAIFNLETVIKLNPQFGQAYHELSFCYLQNHNFSQAINKSQIAIELNPNLAEAYCNLGICLQHEEKIEAAIIQFQKALIINPDLSEALNNLGACLHDIEQYQEAIPYLKKAVEINPNLVEAYYNLGSCLQKENNFQDIIGLYEKAINIDKNNAKAYLGLAIGLLKISNDTNKADFREKAIKYLNKSLELEPNSPEAYCRLATCFYQKGQVEEAIKLCQKAIEYQPDFSLAYYNLGICNRYQANIKQALLNFEKALELNPNDNVTKHLIETITECEKSGYFPQLQQGDNAWDAMLFKDNSYYRLFYLTGSSQSRPFWTVGEIASAISYDLKTWEYQGVIIKPNLDLDWANARILAGSVYKENGIYYFFFAASSSENILHEIIALATSSDGINWEWKQEPFLELHSSYYSTRPSFHEGMTLTHYPWRDPYIVQEPSTGNYYMFFTANSPNPNSIYQGCIGCAVADRIDGNYTLLAPATYPIIEDIGEGIYLEMERPQVIYRDGKYHLFFSVGSEFINPKWLEQLEMEERKTVAITRCSLHWYTADNITGPFTAVGKIPIVQGSPETGLYGTNFMQTLDGEWFAYGCYFWSKTLEVHPRFPVVWNEEKLEILINYHESPMA